MLVDRDLIFSSLLNGSVFAVAQYHPVVSSAKCVVTTPMRAWKVFCIRYFKIIFLQSSDSSSCWEDTFVVHCMNKSCKWISDTSLSYKLDTAVWSPAFSHFIVNWDWMHFKSRCPKAKRGFDTRQSPPMLYTATDKGYSSFMYRSFVTASWWSILIFWANAKQFFASVICSIIVGSCWLLLNFTWLTLINSFIAHPKNHWTSHIASSW